MRLRARCEEPTPPVVEPAATLADVERLVDAALLLERRDRERVAVADALKLADAYASMSIETEAH